LAAILFPVFAQARAKARQTACLSNLKQIGIGIMQYTQDNDGVIPPSQVSYNPPANTSLASWPTLIFPYVKNEDVFVCPSGNEELFIPDVRFVSATGGATAWAGASANTSGGTQTTRRYAGTTNTKNASFNTLGDGSTADVIKVNRLSYGRNLIQNASGSWAKTNAILPGFWSLTKAKSGFAAGAGGSLVTTTTGTTAEITESEVQEPANTIHIFDAITGSATPASNDPRGNGNSIRGIQDDFRTDLFRDDSASKPDYRHNDGFNVLYGDGHAKWRKWGSTTPAEWTIQTD